MTHQCPRNGCLAIVPDDQLACPPHWYQLPAPLRRAVWAAWSSGQGAGTREHRAAIARAVAVMNRDR